MDTVTHLTSDVEDIVRSAAAAGVLEINLHQFDAHLSTLTGNAREDFLQTQWDRI